MPALFTVLRFADRLIEQFVFIPGSNPIQIYSINGSRLSHGLISMHVANGIDLTVYENGDLLFSYGPGAELLGDTKFDFTYSAVDTAGRLLINDADVEIDFPVQLPNTGNLVPLFTDNRLLWVSPLAFDPNSDWQRGVPLLPEGSALKYLSGSVSGDGEWTAFIVYDESGKNTVYVSNKYDILPTTKSLQSISDAYPVSWSASGISPYVSLSYDGRYLVTPQMIWLRDEAGAYTQLMPYGNSAESRPAGSVINYFYPPVSSMAVAEYAPYGVYVQTKVLKTDLENDPIYYPGTTKVKQLGHDGAFVNYEFHIVDFAAKTDEVFFSFNNNDVTGVASSVTPRNSDYYTEFFLLPEGFAISSDGKEVAITIGGRIGNGYPDPDHEQIVRYNVASGSLAGGDLNELASLLQAHPPPAAPATTAGFGGPFYGNGFLLVGSQGFPGPHYFFTMGPDRIDFNRTSSRDFQASESAVDYSDGLTGGDIVTLPKDASVYHALGWEKHDNPDWGEIFFFRAGPDEQTDFRGDDHTNNDNDYVFGGSANEFIDGGYGNDFLSAGSGNDILKGGAGSRHD